MSLKNCKRRLLHKVLLQTCYHSLFVLIFRLDHEPESQNIFDPGLAKPWSELNLGFKNTNLG